MNSVGVLYQKLQHVAKIKIPTLVHLLHLKPTTCKHLIVITIMYDCALVDDGPVRPKLRSSLGILNHYCNSNEVCVPFVGVHCSSCIIMHGMENVKIGVFQNAVFNPSKENLMRIETAAFEKCRIGRSGSQTKS